jgi:serine/threonine-protein kinase HipA
MPFMAQYALLLRFFHGAARRGPGSEASTLRALALCDLPENPSVADLGCGAGASTLILAQRLRAHILAVDADGLALDELWEAAEARGLSHLVEPRTADMAEPDVPPCSLDLIWSEGAIAHVGWEKGLRAWRELLRPGGLMAITDATWLSPDPPAEARQAWNEWYPGIGQAEDRLRIAHELGLEDAGHFALPRQDWWDYLASSERQCQRFEGDAEMAPLIADMRGEAELYRRCGDSYGYVFYILKKR